VSLVKLKTTNKLLTLFLLFNKKITGQPYNKITFVTTNNTFTNMKIEDELKSTIDYNKSTRVVLNVMYTQNVISESFNEILKPYDISGEQYNVLRILRGQKGHPANMCIIQERMLAKTSNTTRLVDKLLLKEYVTRNVCPDNRRKIEVLITQKGLDLLAELDPKVKKHEELFSKNLTPEELEQLNSLLEKYRTKQIQS
jgi:DNA-binding MarR family transcriptional regulator